MLTVDLDKAIELIEMAIAERGEDYVYPKKNACTNVRYERHYDYETHGYVYTMKEADCGVGLGLALGGIDLDLLLAKNESSATETAVYLFEKGVATFTAEAVDFLAYFQLNQDKQRPWGEAKEKALKGLVYHGLSRGYASYGDRPSEHEDAFN